ncbi:MAG TPA: glycosyltransferase [Polyangiaceae bacterium]|nr:glycosyltransferase [Polyangiaceae bacterium]
MPLKLAFFGSSLLSARWNGAVTYYRGILRALNARGHRIVFYEPNAYGRQEHRDVEKLEFARVVVYEGEGGARACLEEARNADLIVKASGVGAHDALLEEGVIDARSSRSSVAFWDVDAPATLERVEHELGDPFRSLIPRFDYVFTYGGGERVRSRYLALGARVCVPIYNAVDPEIHFPGNTNPKFSGDLGFLANRLPDRERRCDDFFFSVARENPNFRFVLGGSGWDDKPRSSNVHYVGHVYTHEHNEFNSSSRLLLNVNRDSMATVGFSPATRIFEAAGAGACIVSDAWEGIESFFEPEREILIATDGDQVARYVRDQSSASLARIGAAARRRALADHSYAQRAVEVEKALTGRGLELAS